MEKERIERQKLEMERLRQKEVEKATASQRKAEEEAIKAKVEEKVRWGIFGRSLCDI